MINKTINLKKRSIMAKIERNKKEIKKLLDLIDFSKKSQKNFNEFVDKDLDLIEDFVLEATLKKEVDRYKTNQEKYIKGAVIAIVSKSLEISELYKQYREIK
jgi:ribosome assembly protein YihI (activator of Der GTPase)